ncbi:MAG: hypothetical protein H6703_11960 [Myxococcales bacterium]|nr:hypothetical protein [Myxococcales bacterium]
MNADERKRLEALKQQRTTAQLLKQLLGVDPSDSYLEGRFRGFLRSTMLWANEKWNLEEIDRSAFELFLAHHRLLPLRAAAAGCHGHRDAERLLVALDERGDIFLDLMSLKADVVDETLIRDIHRSFKSLQAVVFSDHNEFCAMLHAAISSELGLKSRRSAARRRRTSGERFAWQYCMISQQPLSIRYEVKLNLNMKPIRLRPDVCSPLFYARNRRICLHTCWDRGPGV